MLIGGQGLESDARYHRQETISTLVHEGMKQNQFPTDSIAFVAPKNNTVKVLEKLEVPIEMMQMEEAFTRHVGMAFGLPSGLVCVV